MYKPIDKLQHTFLDFNQPIGLQMNPNNRWIKMADNIPWDVFEGEYAALFPSATGNVAKPLRLALGSLIIQTKYQFADRELVEMLTENPYFQYFIGLPGYQQEPPIEASVLVLFRKRISMDMIMKANEYMLSKNHDNDDHQPPSGSSKLPEDKKEVETVNKGTMMLDATCAPSNIRYPQDFSLLNEAREKLENIIDRFSKQYDLKKPRTYRREARKNYLALAKSKKRSTRKIRKTIRKQLGYVRRDLSYLEQYMSEGYALTSKEIKLFLTIQKIYEQQEYMYKNKTHSVENRIVSIERPYLRPIIRGKVKAPVEFGAKFDLSIDNEGYGRIETISFDAYNESTCLQNAVERFKTRTGFYPERVLVDQIYRTRNNRAYCKLHGIRLSGPKLGRPTEATKEDKKQEYQDNTDRIEVERAFSLSKRCYGMGLIRTKLEETTLSSIALSVFVMNLFKIQARILFALFLLLRIFKFSTTDLSPNGA